MSDKLPIPSPNVRDLFTWAKNIVAYLYSLERVVETPGPKAVQLEHKKVNASAMSDGIIMWDSTNAVPVVSKNGNWYGITISVSPVTGGIEDNT